MSLIQGLSSGLTALQDFETLKKGFVKLRDKYTRSIATVSALENELKASRSESEQLKAAFHEELANETAASRNVRINVPAGSP